MRFSRLKIITSMLSILVMVVASRSFAEANNKFIYETSYDCAKATSDVEKTICSAHELADADISMASIYNNLMSNLPTMAKHQLKQDQMTWLKARNQCDKDNNVVGCLKESYRSRINILKNWKVKTSSSATLRSTDADNINGRYEKIGEYDSGELKVNKVGNNKINIKIYASVSNSSCEFGYEYGGAAQAAFAILDNSTAKYTDEKGCKLILNFTNNQAMITSTEECNSFCGVHARGGMDGIYLKRSDIAESVKYEVLDFDFMDASGTVFNSTKIRQQLKAKYGYSAKTVILVETPSFDNDKYRKQESIVKSLGLGDIEKSRAIYVVACSSAEYKSGYHTSIEIAKKLCNESGLFRIRLITDDGHIFNSSDYPLPAEDLEIILHNLNVNQ